MVLHCSGAAHAWVKTNNTGRKHFFCEKGLLPSQGGQALNGVNYTLSSFVPQF